MADVFISYAREDIDFIQDLRQGLLERERDVWVDLEGIYAGEEFWPSICSAIEGSDAFIFVISPESVTSEYCRREIEHAAAHNKRILPILHRDTESAAIPQPAANRQWIFFRNNAEIDESFRSLIEAMDTDVDWVRTHTRLLVRSREWENNKHDNSYVLRGTDLRDAEEWLSRSAPLEPKPTPLQIHYITASRKSTIKRQRILLGTMTFGLIVSVTLAVLAFHQRQTAVRERSIAEARLLDKQGQEVFEDQPLLGLRLVLEGLALTPKDAKEVQASITNTIRTLAVRGRLLKLGTDIQTAMLSPDASRFLLDRSKSPDELRSTVDGGLIAVYEREVHKAEFIFGEDTSLIATHHKRKPKETTELRHISDGSIVPLKQDAGDLFFNPQAKLVVVDNYGMELDEIRRVVDGALLVSLDPPVSGAFFAQNKQAKSFVVQYYSTKGEVRRTDDGSLITALVDEVSYVDFSPDPEAKHFVISYREAPGELRRSTDGDLIATLSGRSHGSLFSPDGTHFIARYTDSPDELRRAKDGSVVVSGLKNVNGVDFSSDSHRYFVLDYGSSIPGELRLTADGSVVADLPHPVASASFSPDTSMKTFFVKYFKEPGELRRIADGDLVWAPGDDARAVLSPDLTYFIVQHTYKPGELRHFTDGSLVQTLTDMVDRLYFNPSSTLFVVNYSSGVRAMVVPAELRRADTGEIIKTLRSSVSKIYFNPNSQTAFFVADYNVGRDVIHRISDGSVIAELSGEVHKVDFKPDANVFVVDYADGRSELWSGRDQPHILAELGLAKQGHVIDQNGERLVLWHTDGRAYLLDLEWLKAMAGDPAKLSPKVLVELACQGPMSTGLIDESAIYEYIGDKPLLSCQ
ncbi:MAG: toll/interleukin-1 receptor domain-containing protein [Candidatus Thiodiazotropha endolucinida]